MGLEIAVWMFPALLVAIFMGFPVAFALMGTSFLFGLLRWPPDALAALLVSKVHTIAGTQILAAIPLFIFMGAMLERSGIAAKLFDAIHLWTQTRVLLTQGELPLFKVQLDQLVGSTLRQPSALLYLEASAHGLSAAGKTQWKVWYVDYNQSQGRLKVKQRHPST